MSNKKGYARKIHEKPSWIPESTYSPDLPWKRGIRNNIPCQELLHALAR
jgi:hypothetical protein